MYSYKAPGTSKKPFNSVYGGSGSRTRQNNTHSQQHTNALGGTKSI